MRNKVFIELGLIYGSVRIEHCICIYQTYTGTRAHGFKQKLDLHKQCYTFDSIVFEIETLAVYTYEKRWPELILEHLFHTSSMSALPLEASAK